jgi:hypothetical protein
MTRLNTSWWQIRWIASVVLALLALAGGIGIRVASAQQPGGWLRALPPEKQMDAIDRQFRGFDLAMFEVNYRYIETYFAAIEGNWDYALYTAEKLAWAMENGFERRPKRRANGEAIFLKAAYPPVIDAIKKKDIALFKQRFDVLRASCNGCHVAEKVPFITIGIPSIKQTSIVNQ